jgi:site-specific DNA recombinase
MVQRQGNRVVVYTRVSVARSDEETSTDRQLARCKNYAKAQDWTVVGHHTDRGISAFTGVPRPGWAEVLADAQAGRVDVVLVFALDRAGRKTADLLTDVNILKDHGVAFVSATQPIDTSSVYGGIILAVLAAVAEMESAIKRERANSKRVEEPDRPYWGGRRPFGYRPEGKGRQLVQDPDEARLVREGAAAILNGASFRSVARSWTEVGSRTSQEKDWTAAAVSLVFTNERIAGVRDGKPAPWDPIVTRSTFDRVQAEIGSRQYVRHSDRYLLTGLAACGVCGAKMVGRPSAGVRKYICKATGSVHLSVTAEPVEQFVESASARMSMVGQTIEDLSTIAPELRARLADIDQRLADISDAIVSGDLSPALAGKAERKLEAERAVLFAEIESEAASYAYLGESDNLTLRDVLDATIERVTVKPATDSKPRVDPDRIEIVWRGGVEPINQEPEPKKKK